MSEQSLPELIGGRYKPIRLIGQGGMGAVYEVEHAHTGDRLALKVLLAKLGSSDEAHERFRREARASARIKSEHVVRITDADIAPELHNAPFIVMELLLGMDLEQYAATHTPVPTEIIEWLRQVARAVDKAHRIGIVHRDLKPENVFLANRDEASPIAKVLDYGIAKMTEDGGVATRSGQILGTPRYMAPEQAAGKSAEVGCPADLFALGLIAYRMLVGEHYYKSDTVMSVLGEVLHKPIEAPSKRGSTFGAGFDAWFLKACNKDPALRYDNALIQIEDLAEALRLPRIEPTSRSQPDARPSISPNPSDSARIAEGTTLAAPHPSSPDNSSSPSKGTKPSGSIARSADSVAASGQHGASVSVGLGAGREPRRSVPIWFAVAAVVGALGIGVYVSRSGPSPAPTNSAAAATTAPTSAPSAEPLSANPNSATSIAAPPVSAAAPASTESARPLPIAPIVKHSGAPVATARPQEIATSKVAEAPPATAAPAPPKPSVDPYDGQK